MFKSRSRRSRGTTLIQELNPSEVTSLSVVPARSDPIAVPEAPDSGPKPANAPEELESPICETPVPEIAANILPTAAIGQTAHSSEGANAATNTKLAKGPGDERPTNDQAIVEDMKTKFTAPKSAPLWNRYVKIAEAEDKDILEDWEGAIDVTLVFAALFSAISTGFVLESSKNLKPDQGAATVLAIRELTSVVQAGFHLPTVNTLSPRELAALGGSFQPSTIDVWVNCLWFLSLGLSISVSLFAMLAKRWCYRSRAKHSRTDYERAMRRQKAWDTLQKWKLELLIEQLPTVMHVALMSFFIGLVLYLSEIHRATMIITAIPVGFTILSYGALTVLPAWSPAFPMVTPFTRIMQAGTWYAYDYGTRAWGKVRDHSLFLRMGKVVDAVIPGANRVINVAKRSTLVFRYPRTQNIDTETKSTAPSVSPKDWIINGRPQPTGKTIPYPRSEEQRYPFRALLWLLRNSNDKSLINEVFEYVSSFPEVVLDSFASSQELYDATIVITEHFQRLKHDAVEWHDLNATQFSAKCGRFIYLIARPWLHYSVSASRGMQGHILDIYHFMFAHNPNMSTEEVEAQLKVIKEKKFPDPGCILWLEREAVKIVLGCPPETGFKLCRALFQSVTATVPPTHDQAEEIYSTLSWMFLNTITDASGGGTFWPRHGSWATIDSSDDGEDSKPVADCDSTLTLSYFRHSETRKENSEWLKVVGLSGMLNVPTYYVGDVEPDTPPNQTYYKSIADLLRATLSRVSELATRDGEDPYIGKLPVHWKSQVRLYEFDALQYCHDALDRAIKYPRFSELSGDLKKLKDMIPEDRRLRPIQVESKSKLEIRASTTELPTVLRELEDVV
ncbi:hypothetical protein FRC11_015013 [Ceratobasidium sp. 423]|nr:hypothetical protein FRC11_015013 [Ceratobasidium sp. 423]